MFSQIEYKQSKMGIRNILLVNWAPPHIILNDPVKKPTMMVIDDDDDDDGHQ